MKHDSCICVPSGLLEVPNPRDASLVGIAPVTFNACKVSPQPDGSFTIADLRPGSYIIIITGDEITPVKETVSLTHKNLTLPPIALSGTGTIMGSVSEMPPGHYFYFTVNVPALAIPREVGGMGDFAIPFTPDRNGNFRVDDVPVGTAEITITRRDGCVVTSASSSVRDRAAQVAKDLIVQDKIDLMLVASTPETTNPVSTQCEIEEVPCISTMAPWQPWVHRPPGRSSRRTSGVEEL